MMPRKTPLIAGCVLVALLGCAKKPLTPATPWADLAGDSLSFFVTGTDPGGLKVCYIFDWGDGTETTTEYCASGDTTYCSHGFSDTRVHYIRARSHNEKGAASGWSDPLRFRLTEPPQLVDTIAGLPRWATDRWYHASVRITDPDGDSVAVRFLWGDLPAAGWSGFVPSGSVITDSCRWSAVGPHTVGVILRDRGGTVSRPRVVKPVSVSEMAVTWYNVSEERCYDATPTLGMIDGQQVIYFTAEDGIDCFDLVGHLRWTAETGADGNAYAASLSPDGTRLYVAGSEGLLCLDAQTGQRKWLLPLDTLPEGAVKCTPTLGPYGAIYVAVTGSNDFEVGRVRDYGDSAALEWLIDLGEGGLDQTSVGRDGVVYAIGRMQQDFCDRLFAIESTGAVLWIDSTTIRFGGVPAIDSRDRLLTADCWGDQLLCFEPDGSLRWSAAIIGPCTGSTAVAQDDRILVTNLDGRATAFDSNGQEQWSSDLKLVADNVPCIADDGSSVFYDPDDGLVYGLATDGKVLWEFSILDSLGLDKRRARKLDGSYDPSAVIGQNGDLYLAGPNGVFCLSGANLHMANTAWPTYNHDNAHSGWAGRQQR